MPRYVFHVFGGQPPLDDEGHDLPSDDVTRIEAVRMAGEMQKEQPSTLLNVGGLVADVPDERGVCRLVLDMRAIEGITLEPADAAV
ncbi:hypothetical protein J8J14_13510 [Roseomonas sp. SSH11]|uniref:DUF6894 domain-containing protein n=1 Tax=Pararoseomonas baculiformis TaxID=2820812 RepID=A0ABS4AFH2_9PROT|nr:hypothetical protein [Pararoseomonas baculiformis]MBP0445792.1 hypothetical protein [Pararoseomonas baculiformis]